MDFDDEELEEDIFRRSGETIVIPHDSTLPNFCVRCGQEPSGPPIPHYLNWHHPAWFLFILAGLILYVPIALAVNKGARVNVPVCARHKRYRLYRMVLVWTGVTASFVVFCIGVGGDITDTITEDTHWWFLGLGTAGMAVFGAWACYVSMLVSARKIDDDHVWVKRVHPSILDRLSG